MNRNYYNFWTKRYIKDGLRFMKLVIGIGLSISLGIYLNIPIGIMFFGWVLVETLQEKE